MIRFNNNYNNYNNCSASFSGVRKETGKMPDKETVLNKIVTTSNGMLASAAEKQVPENGKFKPITIEYKIPDTVNMAKITIECDENEPKATRRLSVGVHHQNADRLISNYVFKGDKNQVIEYLNNADNAPDFVNTIKELSEKTDDYYNNL